MSFLAAVFGFSALLAYSYIWWRIRTRGPQVLRFSVKSPTIKWLEDWIEPVLLVGFLFVVGWQLVSETVSVFQGLF